MIQTNSKLLTLILCLATAISAKAQSATTYEITIRNGSQMPISPSVIYTKSGVDSSMHINAEPSAGFIQICQSGNIATRLVELKMDSTVKHLTQTTAPIMPGESKMLDVVMANPEQQSVHFETMYGKTKDVCGVATINSHSLVALKQHVTSEIIQKDSTVLTGAFIDPALPMGISYLDASFCPTAASAISCLRELAVANKNKAQVRFFAGYSPSLVMALESKYGAADVSTLLFPTSGAIELTVKLKH